MDEIEGPQLTRDEVLWVKNVYSGQRAAGKVAKWMQSIGIWVAAVVGGVLAITKFFHPGGGAP